MTDDDDGVDEPAEESHEDAETGDRIRLTPEQAERLRRAMSSLQESWALQIKLPTFKLPADMLRNITASIGIMQGQQAIAANAIQPILGAQAGWQKQITASIARDIFKNMAPALVNFGQITEQLTNNIDFRGISQSLDIVAKVGATFADQQSALFKNLGPALEAMRVGFYTPNLRAIDELDFEEVITVVMVEGIPLYALPRTATAEALIRADSPSKRREVLGRRWRTISADCREAVLGCTSNSVAPYVPFAVAALDALDAGHSAAAQALAGSLIDTIVTGYFGDDRYKYTPSKKNPTNDAYDEFTIREYVAFAPMWQTYQQFFVNNGDKVPTRFSRHATAHAVSSRQYNRRNAIQGLMFACSLLYRLDEEAATLASAV